MVLGRFLWFLMGKNLQKLNWHGTDVRNVQTSRKLMGKFSLLDILQE